MWKNLSFDQAAIVEKLVTLKLGPGSLETGFAVVVQISEGQGWPIAEMMGNLPPAANLLHTYQRWQVAYRRLGLAYRLGVKKGGFATNVSRVEDCREVAQALSQQFNQWLQADSFRPLQDKLLEKLDPREPVRVVVQTSEAAVMRLPWSTWDLCDRYPKAEIALSAPTFERLPDAPSSRPQVRVLAVLGHSADIDVATDQALLNQLPNAEVVVLAQPDRPTLNTYLWDIEGWDILFFAGHSASQPRSDTEMVGQIFINPTESLTIDELKHALRKSLERGLQIALFNSCDGLGLARALAELHIPQILVMREPVPDLVAHEFLKSFLGAFSRGSMFYLAVREAREKLHGLEGRVPCATWLPIIFQNPAISPPTWTTLATAASPLTPPQESRHGRRHQRRSTLLVMLFVGLFAIGLHQLGLLQHWELKAFDQFMGWRAVEGADPRLVVVTVTEADVQKQAPELRRGSLSDPTLSTVLAKLESMNPQLIGLDIYRDFSVQAGESELAQQLANADNLIAICKVSGDATPGISPPPEVAQAQVGFSDFVIDADQTIRRHLLALTPDPASPCRAEYGFSTLLALNYLAAAGIAITATPEGNLQVGDVVFTPLETHFGGYQGLDARGHQMMLNYRSLPNPEMIAEQVALADLLADRVDPNAIRDRIVLIGTTAPSFGDFWQTPASLSTANHGELAGVFMQAHMTSQLLSAVLDDRPLLKTWPPGVEVLWILLWVSIGGAIAGWLPIYPLTKSTIGKGVLVVVLAELALIMVSWQLLAQWGYWVPWVPSAIALPLTVGGAAALTLQSLSQPVE